MSASEITNAQEFHLNPSQSMPVWAKRGLHMHLPQPKQATCKKLNDATIDRSMTVVLLSHHHSQKGAHAGVIIT